MGGLDRNAFCKEAEDGEFIEDLSTQDKIECGIKLSPEEISIIEENKANLLAEIEGDIITDSNTTGGLYDDRDFSIEISEDYKYDSSSFDGGIDMGGDRGSDGYEGSDPVN